MAEKIRYYLEQQIPELQDLQKKKLFNQKEITMIMRRRTDFEHRINGRGSKPNDFLKYIQFEMILDKLRKKRLIRFKDLIDIKGTTISDYAGQRRIFFIFERGVNKYPKSMELWSGYLKYAKKNGSIKIIYETYSKLLQLQPRNINVWLSAAKYEFEKNKNIKSSRDLFKRCLRFNNDSIEVWNEFIKFELNYLSKLLIRRKLFGLISERQQIEDLSKNELNTQENIISINNEELNDELNQLPELNLSTLGTIETNPVLRGDLILTLYDVGLSTILKKTVDNNIKQDRFNKMFSFSYGIIQIIDQFEIMDRNYLLNHIIKRLIDEYPMELKIIILNLTLNLRYLKKSNDDEFVQNLQNSIKGYHAWFAKEKDNDLKMKVKLEFIKYLTDNYISNDDDDETTKLLKLLIKKI
ncbi:hypothetical protein CANARDRAFT_24882 [[Candida] arabinofermentans NRRL YB-2248]|uniref:mRNA 3'-end-processing protein RNA14 n=1 Tax=[Candida] arabinofermentans NRRL YB-2248 TaxID=983967 RepID=A0A1E4SVW4_9ASCO|nr:hypothetical protein CANARDRAFT_24882 [[Candida] arabinofermentans NRRL YB-2248]